MTEREAEYPAWSPDGTRIAFMSMEPGAAGSNPEYEIYVVRANGTGVRRLTSAAGEDGWPAWSPDGGTIAFSSARSGRPSGDIGPLFEIWLMNADGSHQRRLSDVFGQFPAWSPDGEWVLISPGAHLAGVDGTTPATLPYRGPATDLLFPDWVNAAG